MFLELVLLNRDSGMSDCWLCGWMSPSSIGSTALLTHHTLYPACRQPLSGIPAISWHLSSLFPKHSRCGFNLLSDMMFGFHIPSLSHYIWHGFQTLTLAPCSGKGPIYASNANGQMLFLPFPIPQTYFFCLFVSFLSINRYQLGTGNFVTQVLGLKAKK